MPKLNLQPALADAVPMSHQQRSQRRRHIASFILLGGTYADAVKRFGVTTETVRRACAEYGVPSLRERQCARNRRIAASATCADTYDDIASRFGVSKLTAIKACKEYNVLVPRRQRIANSTYRILALLQNTPLSLSAIANEVGVTRQRVHQILRRGVFAQMKFPLREWSFRCHS